MIGERMPDLDAINSELVDLVERLEIACVFEAAQPGTLERLGAAHASVLREPSTERLVFVVQAASIALGRLTASHRLRLSSMGDIVERFAQGQLAGLSALSRHVDHSRAELLLHREAELRWLLSAEATSAGAIRVDDESRNLLARARPPHHAVGDVMHALAVGLGTLAKLHKWNGAEVVQIVQQTHEGVLAGEVAREKGDQR
jgi:hypothetical protein